MDRLDFKNKLMAIIEQHVTSLPRRETMVDHIMRIHDEAMEDALSQSNESFWNPNE